MFHTFYIYDNSLDNSIKSLIIKEELIGLKV